MTNYSTRMASQQSQTAASFVYENNNEASPGQSASQQCRETKSEFMPAVSHSWYDTCDRSDTFYDKSYHLSCGLNGTQWKNWTVVMRKNQPDNNKCKNHLNV